MTDTRQQHLDAIKLDILDMLERPDPRIFEFRRIVDIASIAQGLLGATDVIEQRHATEGILRATEVKAPHLHKVLLGQAFDGKALLRARYEKLRAQELELKIAALNIEEAADVLKQTERRLDAHKEALVLHEKHLERERERLALTAASRGVQLMLPELPHLVDPDAPEETEDEEPLDPPASSTRENY